MRKRKLGALEVSALGLGCMSMSEYYGPIDEERSIQTIQQAFEMGINFFDTADVYGLGHNEELIGKAVKGFRDKVIIATKFGIVRKKDDPQFMQVCGKPTYIKQQCEKSLKRLGIETIDLYYQHRFDPNTPIEETIGAMSELIKEGKVRFLGLSEASPTLIRQAHVIHPITALQTEYSLWSRDPENSILKTCEELNIGFVAYSPIGRGFLSGKIKSTTDLSDDDFRRHLPRFQGENFEHNFKIVKVIEEMAKRKKCTASQLALAWILSQGDYIVPIFGTTRPTHLKENLGSVDVILTKEDLQILNQELHPSFVHGERYPTFLQERIKEPAELEK